MGPFTEDDIRLMLAVLGATKTYTRPGKKASTHSVRIAAGQFPRLMGGDTLVVTITDHASHMANVFMVLTFQEGYPRLCRFVPRLSNGWGV